MLRRLVFCFICFGIFSTANAQTATLQFDLSSKDAVIRIGDLVFNYAEQQSIELPIGIHEIEIWAPLFEVHKKQVEVLLNQKNILTFGLTNRVSSYDDYQEEQSKYLTYKLKRSISGGTMVAGNVALGYLFFIDGQRNARNLLNEANDLLVANQSVVGIDGIRITEARYEQVVIEYNEAKEKVQQQNTYLVPVFALAAAATTYILVKRRKNRVKRPVFNPQNPFSGIISTATPSIAITPAGVSFGATLKF